MYNPFLLHCRENLGLTHEEIARKAGLSTKRYTLLEAGKTIILRREANLLAKVFKTHPDYLILSVYQQELLWAYKELNMLLKYHEHTKMISMK